MVAVVAFEEARTPELAARVRLDEWEGPLGLLLSLIEARELDVLSVPLGALAEAYLDALAGLTDDRLPHLSTFVAVAGQLILIKSRALLPRPPVVALTAEDAPDPEAELRARLLLYKAYRDAGGVLATTASERIGLFRREASVALASGRAGAVPADEPPIDPIVLVRALGAAARVALPPEPPPTVVARTITLTERARIIRAAIADAGTVVLQEILHGVRDRVVIAITFLAMLELMKRREIVVEQAAPWGPIVARATTPEERATAGVADTAADEPLDESLAGFE